MKQEIGKNPDYRKTAAVTGLLLVIIILFSIFAGNDALKASDAWKVLTGSGSATHQMILFRIRLPRVLAAVAAGAALAVAGFLLQSCLNNVLASPGIVGINSGAGLFVLLSGLLFPYMAGMKCFMAFAGALLAAGMVYLVSFRIGMSKSSVILVGVAISGLCSSGIDVIISLKPETVADKAAFHLGGFAALNLSAVQFSVPVIAITLGMASILAPGLDVIMLGDETASGLGLDVRLYRGASIVCAALLAAAAVSMSGLLGFVGLIVPNFLRLFYRGKSRNIIGLCIMGGAAFLLLCDTLARLLVFPYELPCGLLLSGIGTPFFMWLLIEKRKRIGNV